MQEEEYVYVEKYLVENIRSTVPIRAESKFIPTNENLNLYYTNSIAKRFLVDIKESHPLPLLGAIAVKMEFFQRFSGETEKSSELLLSDIHFNINTIVSEIIFEKFKTEKDKLLLRTNQKTTNTAMNHLETILYYNQFPLLVCKYKPTISNKEITQHVNSLLMKFKSDVLRNCKPIILIINQYNFILYEFVTNLGMMYNQRPVLRPIRLFKYSNAITFSLDDVLHVYAAVKVIVECASTIINWLIEKTSASQAITNIQIENAPQTQQETDFSHYKMFTLSNNNRYAFCGKYNGTLVTYKNISTQQLCYIKMIDERELKNYEIASKISAATIPAQVISLKKVPTNDKVSDYMLLMPCGNEVELRQIPLDTACTQLLEGIANYHANNFIHMDVKPSNVVVFQENLYFIDFELSLPFHHEENGIAYDENNEPLQERSGTEGFWAPELVNGDDYGTKADCYSCGVTILCFLEYYSTINKKDSFLKKSKIVTQTNVMEFFKSVEANPNIFKYLGVVVGLLRNNPLQRISAKDALEIIADPNKLKYTQEETELLQQMMNQSTPIQYNEEHLNIYTTPEMVSKNMSGENTTETLLDATITMSNEMEEIVERSFENVNVRKRSRVSFEKSDEDIE